MVSESYETGSHSQVFQVLILVVVEDGLRVRVSRPFRSTLLVLILVVVEDGLREVTPGIMGLSY